MDESNEAERARRAAEGVAAEGGPLGLPPTECAAIAQRRWGTSSRRGVDQDDFERRIDDLAVGLVQRFEPEPDLVGSLLSDYRYLAATLAHAIDGRPRPALDALVAAVDRVRSNRSPVLVAIDGMSAAGKSTLAGNLAERRDASVVHGDDFYRVMDDAKRFVLPPDAAYQQDFDWQRLLSEAILPLRQGRSARFQRYDWSSGGLGEWATIEAREIVVVEGVYVSRPELRELFDLKIWVETPADIRAARQRTRNDSPAWVERWDRAEQFYVTEFSPAGSADLVVGQ